MSKNMTVKINNLITYTDVNICVSTYENDAIKITVIYANENDTQSICEATIPCSGINKNEILLNSKINPFLIAMFKDYDLGSPTDKEINGLPVYKINEENISAYGYDIEETI